MNRITAIVVCSCLLVFAAPAMLFAQSVAEEAPPKFIFGPVGLTPRIALRNIGFDTNPLNLPGETERDFTVTVEPGLDSALRIGRGRLTAKTFVEYLHFAKTRSQRSFNFNQEARAEVTLNRLRPYAAGAYLRTRQRPTPEVDLRVQQNTTRAALGTSVFLGSRLRLDLEGERSRYEFGRGTYGDREVANALNRESDVGSLAARFILTPLTTFVVRSEVQQDRFKFSAVRDNDSVSVVPGFEFKPSALVSGSVFVGFRRFAARHTTVPDFAGVVGEIDARYIYRDSTLFGLGAERDVVYSIQPDQPYYVNNNGQVSVTQSIGLNWYVLGRLGETRLDYRDFVRAGTAAASSPARTDRLLTRGFGVGRRLGEDIRVGFDLDFVRRRSTEAHAQYEGYRFGGSISYGSQTR